MSKPLKIFLRFLSIFLIILLSFSCWIVYAGRYWENLPILDQISGPLRFKEIVQNPIPHGLSNIKGGYYGFPQGTIITRFDFDTSFKHELKNWPHKRTSQEVFNKYEGLFDEETWNLIGTTMNSAHKAKITFLFKTPEINMTKVIILNHDTRKGLLYYN